MGGRNLSKGNEWSSYLMVHVQWLGVGTGRGMWNLSVLGHLDVHHFPWNWVLHARQSKSACPPGLRGAGQKAVPREPIGEAAPRCGH